MLVSWLGDESAVFVASRAGNLEAVKIILEKVPHAAKATNKVRLF